MEKLCKNIIKILKNKKQTISFMESCTGGFLASSITNIEGASDVIKVSLITYSNEYKIKFGVNEETINKYNVYSINTAEEMSKRVTLFADSDWGIGVTGQLGVNDNNKVYYSIYNKDMDKNCSFEIIAHGETREKKKEYISKQILIKLLEQINR